MKTKKNEKRNPILLTFSVVLVVTIFLIALPFVIIGDSLGFIERKHMGHQTRGLKKFIIKRGNKNG